MLYIRIHNLMLADHVQTTYALRRGPKTNLNDIDAKQNIYIRNTVMTNRRTGWICTQTCVVVYYSTHAKSGKSLESSHRKPHSKLAFL